MEWIQVGFDHAVVASRIVAVVSTNSAPVTRLIREAKKARTLIDLSHGRRAKSVLLTDSNYILLISRMPSTIIKSTTMENQIKEGYSEK